MLGVAGHVDHGKTSLVKLLTGCETDRLAEEKARGLTIELGFAPCRMADDRIVGVVDVPGHVSFIRNMVAGAQGVDVLILVVAADDGVMPQTREHLDVLTLMGARCGLMALTKIDMVDAEMRELAAEELRQFVQGTFLADAPICPISNITGEGFDAFFTALNQQVGGCLGRAESAMSRVLPYRQWIERSFTAHGFGVVASGVPGAGRVELGQTLRVLPGGKRGRVRRLQVYGDNAESAQAGECVAANLADLSLDDAPRGGLLTASTTLDASELAACRLQLLKHIGRPLRDNTEVHLHIGTAHVQAKVALLEGGPLEPGAATLAQLRLDRPLAVVPGERFVMRQHVGGDAGLTTIAGGRVLDITPTRLRRKRPEVLARLAAREAALDDPAAWCLTLLAEAGGPQTASELAAASGLLESAVTAVLTQLHETGDALDAGDGRRHIARATVESAGRRIVACLQQHHAARPDQLGLAAPALADALQLDAAVAGAACRWLVEQQRIAPHSEVFALPEHKPQIDADDQRLLAAVLEAYRGDALAPQRPEDLAAALGERDKRVAPLLRLLIDRGDLVALSDAMVMHRDAIAAAAAVVRELFDRSDRFTTAEFRDALGVSRKYVIPLLDYFDRIRLTVRHGSVRTPGAKLRGES